jgi:hypothetical protein
VKCFSNFTDNNDEDIGCGNLNILQTDSVNYLTQSQHQVPHKDSHKDLHGCERFNQFGSSSDNLQLQSATPEDEQRLLESYGKEATLLFNAGASKPLENQKPLYQNETSKHNESPRPSNAYLTPIRQQNLSNEQMKYTTQTSPVASAVHPQSYLNMDGNSKLTESEKTGLQKQQDLLCFVADKTSSSTPKTSKVTDF